MKDLVTPYDVGLRAKTRVSAVMFYEMYSMVAQHFDHNLGIHLSMTNLTHYWLHVNTVNMISSSLDPFLSIVLAPTIISARSSGFWSLSNRSGHKVIIFWDNISR